MTCMRESLERAVGFLIAARNPDDGWGYSSQSGQSAPEPSCYSLLALADHPEPPDRQRTHVLHSDVIRNGLSFLHRRIGPDGGVRYEGDADLHWSTSLAAFTLARLDPDSPTLRACIRRLLTMRGSLDKAVGWPWTERTYSWVEPTCYALLALKAAGHGDHLRVAEAQRMLQARTCAGGGWNQGLVTALHQQLSPLPVQTALAILALQRDTESHTAVVRATAVLRAGLVSRPTVLSLAWATLALHGIGEDVGGFPAALEARQESNGSWRDAVHLTALSVLALKAGTEGQNVFRL